MSAATACFLALAPGDHVVVPKVMYWSLRNWLATFATQWGLEVEFVDADRTDTIAAAVRPNATRLVWLETPANPTWAVSDIAAAAEIAHKAGALLAVDFDRRHAGADPADRARRRHRHAFGDQVPQRPFRHHRRRAGRRARRRALGEAARAIRAQLGTILGQTEAWLLMRGMRTLFPRVQWACRSAETLAQKIRRASHGRRGAISRPPVLRRTHCGEEADERGFGGMLSVRVKGGERLAIASAARVELWKRATSLGGVESLVEHRASIEGPGTPCPPDLLRLSVGVGIAATCTTTSTRPSGVRTTLRIFLAAPRNTSP
jgi:cystathionine gamma-synthase